MAAKREQVFDGDVFIRGDLRVAGEVNDGEFEALTNTSTYGQDRTVRLFPRGVADEQTYINAAIVTLAAAGGGVIHMVEGDWNLSAVITGSYTNITIVGEGKATRLIVNHTGYGVQFSGTAGAYISGCGIMNLSIENGSGVACASALIYVQYNSTFTADGLTIKNYSQGYGVFTDYAIDSSFSNLYMSYITPTAAVYGFRASNSSGYLRGSRFVGTGVEASYAIIGYVTYLSTGFELSECSAFYLSSSVYAYGFFAYSESTIRSSSVCGLSGSGNKVGIHISETASHTQVIDCVVDGITGIGSGIAINIADYVTVVGCKVVNAPIGILVNAATSDYTKILNNYCYNNGADTTIVNTGGNFTDVGTNTQVWGNSWQCISSVWDLGVTASVDHINEHTAAHGVNIDGVLLKDNFVNTDKVIAQTAAGLSLFEDGGKGIFVQDSTGYTGFLTTNPLNAVHILSPEALRISDNETAATQKYSAIKLSQYDSAAESEGYTLIGGIGASGNNLVYIGGGFGGSNAATQISFYTATNLTTRTGTERMTINYLGNVGIGTTAPDALLEIECGTTFGGQAVTIDQNDIDQAFIDFQGESEAGAAKNLSSWTVAALNGYLKVEINGTAKWIAFYNAPTS